MPYIFIFAFSFGVCLLFTYIFLKIGRKYHFFDIAPEDDPLKIHKQSISYLGGMGMICTLAIGFLVMAFEERFLITQLTAIFLGAVSVFFLGFWDDLNWKNIPEPKPYKKFAGLIIFPLLAMLFLLWGGLVANISYYLIINYSAAFLLMFVLVNSINYEDGIDGLAGGLVFISVLGFFVLSLLFNIEMGLLLALLSCGAIVGFLVFNFPPAKIFMGDSGAFFLGFLLGVFSLFFLQPYHIFSWIGILFILGLPVFDGVFTNLRRIFNKKSIFLGDREHFYDILYLEKGFSIQKTLLICYLIQGAFVIIGVTIYANTVI